MAGINAALLDEALRVGVEWTSLFVPTRLIGAVDYQGAAEAVEALNRMLGLGVDAGQLRAASEAVAKAAEAQRMRRGRGGILGGVLRRGGGA